MALQQPSHAALAADESRSALDRFLACCTILGATFSIGLNVVAYVGRFIPAQSPIYIGSIVAWILTLALLARCAYAYDRRLNEADTCR